MAKRNADVEFPIGPYFGGGTKRYFSADSEGFWTRDNSYWFFNSYSDKIPYSSVSNIKQTPEGRLVVEIRDHDEMRFTGGPEVMGVVLEYLKTMCRLG